VFAHEAFKKQAARYSPRLSDSDCWIFFRDGQTLPAAETTKTTSKRLSQMR
jgi:hypothetical protein